MDKLKRRVMNLKLKIKLNSPKNNIEMKRRVMN